MSLPPSPGAVEGLESEPAEAAAVFGDRLPVVRRYAADLAEHGIVLGLIGPLEPPRLWSRHVLNSGLLAPLVPEGVSVADVGSGAGLPGVPLAILRPDLDVTLLEPLLRRSTFLDETVAELGLGERVRVIRGRAEDQRDRYQVVTARALAPLPRLVQWCDHLRGPDGQILALKGASAAEEVATATAALRSTGLRAEVLQLRAHPLTEPTIVVRLAGR